ncbi:hypothetical protein AB0B45_15105 [Nonomuraea sp. NPDC049152]|uniref:hypothetical protein n=1 Tax=Nonomuraea sp. NPDC049152 TaxID=3154350 RepID=UPI003404842A
MLRQDVELAPYHGTHPAPRRADCEPVAWYESTLRCERVRVRAHTCGCRNTVYELCAAAGVLFVRRLKREDGSVNVRETSWLRAAEALRLWAAILDGRAA